MKKTIGLSLLGLAISAVSMNATVLFNDTFSYSDGTLVGQGPWQQTGTTSTTPIQVSSGHAVVGTSGQDIFAPLSSTYTIPDGTTFYLGLDVTVTAAQAAGDYFFHTTPTVGNTGTFVERLFAKSSGSGFVLGYEETAGGPAVVNYGSTVLDFNTSYRVVIAYNAVAGALNDTASVYVDPTDLTLEGNNTPYIANDTWTSTSPESDAVAAVNLRQGTAANAPSVDVDNITAGTTFGDVAPSIVPEPSTLALLSLGGLLGAGLARLKK